MTIENADLRQFIMLFFNDDELEDFCADYFADVAQDFTVGMTKSHKVRLLIGYVDRRNRREHLLAALAKERPGHYGEQIGRAPTLVVTPALLTRDRRRVFISHAHQDAATAQRLAAGLAAAGRPVWIAPDSILPGEQWVDAIGRGLEISGIFVLLLSPEAVASNWVRYETSLAIILEKQGKMDILPLDWRPCDPPITWQGFHYVPFRNYEQGLDALLGRLDNTLASPAVSTAPPRPRPSRRIHEKTGIELIRIPAGPFLYGSSDADKMARDNEKPQRTVDLPEYWIGRYPVTNVQYKRFLDATPNHRVPFIDADWAKPYNWDAKSRGYPANKADHPVVLVSWGDAKAFCDWAGLILPTEEQWEKAARGTNGRLWPWGNAEPTDGHCNFNGNVGGTTPVGRYSPRGDSPWGCGDMAGNVWEWTGSWFSQGSRRALRGGSWYVNARNTCAAYRYINIPDDWINNVGFRVAELISDPGF